MTKGQIKLKLAMQSVGYKTVSEKTGISVSLLNSFLNGDRDPKKMKLSTALKLRNVYDIEPLEWLES